MRCGVGMFVMIFIISTIVHYIPWLEVLVESACLISRNVMMREIMEFPLWVNIGVRTDLKTETSRL